MSTQNYIQSEKFIHDILLSRAERAVRRIPELWRHKSERVPLLYLWPTHALKTPDGAEIKDLVFCVLEGDPPAHTQQINLAIKKTNAYAFLLVRAEEEHIQALFESPHGTRAWLYPFQRSADVYVLGKPTVVDNQRTLGLLWSNQQGHA